MREVRLQPLVGARSRSLGETGAAWTEALPGRLDELAGQWHLRLGRALPGGSASYVVSARAADGTELVLKVGLPDADLGAEAATLREASGRGYVVLHDHDPDHNAVLLERLGDSLERTPMAVEDKLRLLTDTLRTAWQVATGRPRFDKAADLAAGLTTYAVGVEVDPDVLEQAHRHADWLSGTAGSVPSVLVHGDPHPANLLRATADRPGAATGWLFVDPDGFRCEPAYDLGVVLRDWSARLLGGVGGVGGDAAATRLLRGWCDLVSERAAVDADRVWAWAFLERVSTGLYVSSFGAPRVGRPFLDSAARLLDR